MTEHLVLHRVYKERFLTINIESGRMLDGPTGVVRATCVATAVLGSDRCQVQVTYNITIRIHELRYTSVKTIIVYISAHKVHIKGFK